MFGLLDGVRMLALRSIAGKRVWSVVLCDASARVSASPGKTSSFLYGKNRNAGVFSANELCAAVLTLLLPLPRKTASFQGKALQCLLACSYLPVSLPVSASMDDPAGQSFAPPALVSFW